MRHRTPSSSPGSLRWLLVLAAALALALSAAACGGGDDEAAESPPPAAEETPTGEEAPAEETEEAAEGKATECPVEDGVIDVFQTNDLAGVAGDLGPSSERMAEVYVEHVNETGGIAGCELAVEMVDEPFPDVDQCLSNWRTAISSGEYDAYMAAFNSACMAALPELTNAAGQPIIANNAADHQPFFERFQPLNFHASVSTFLEGRASAKFMADKGWKRIAIVAPNYAYGQDVVAAFKDYFLELVPDGEIVAEQFPEFGTANMTPFQNALVASNPDAIMGALFAGDAVTWWGQWIAGGHEDIPVLTGLVGLPSLELLNSADEIPENTYGYVRGWWQVVQETPSGQEAFDLYTEAYGDSEHPVPSAWTNAWVSGVQMLKALVEETGTVDGEAWKEAVETGEFTFESVYADEPIGVNPINHMANTCAQVGKITWNEELPVPGSYDLEETVSICMDDILPEEQARELTDNPDVTDEAIAAYYGG